MNIFKKLLRRRSPVSDRDRIRNQIVAEVEYATALAGFLLNAFNRGHGVRITVQVDGQECGVGILAHAKEPLVEYLANWAAGEKLKKQDRLAEFDEMNGTSPENPSGRIPDWANFGALQWKGKTIHPGKEGQE